MGLKEAACRASNRTDDCLLSAGVREGLQDPESRILKGLKTHSQPTEGTVQNRLISANARVLAAVQLNLYGYHGA